MDYNVRSVRPWEKKKKKKGRFNLNTRKPGKSDIRTYTYWD